MEHDNLPFSDFEDPEPISQSQSLLEPQLESHLDPQMEPQIESHLEPQLGSEHNPWNVKNIQEFLYFCCPECGMKDQSQDSFVKHALDIHPDSREFVVNLQIKTEVFDESYDNYEDSESFYYGGEMVDCEIKEEHHEQNKNSGPKKPQIKGSNLKLLIELVEQSGLSEVGKYSSLKRNTIWRKITQDYNNITGHNKTVEQVRTKWKNHLQNKEYDLSGGKKSNASSELKLIIDLVDKHGLAKIGRFDSQRKVIWEKITDEFNQSTGIVRTIKQIRNKWNSYVHNKEKEFASENTSENLPVKCEIKEENMEQFDESMEEFFNNDNLLKDEKPSITRKKAPKEEEIDLKHKCDICGKGYGREFKLDLHKKKVHGIVTVLKCEHCNKDFTQKCHLNYHIQNVHEKSLSVICDLCGNTFSNQASLQRHHQIVHQKIKNFVCNFCSKAFSENRDLKMHIKCVHEGIKDHICAMCGQAFGMRKSLKIHIRNIHEGIKDQICKYCHKAFATLSRLNEHTKVVHQGIRRHKCKICDKEFVTPSKVRLHMKNTHPGVTVDSLGHEMKLI